MKYGIVWHRRDLRVADNHALSEAAKHTTPVPIFVIDPFFFRENNETFNDRILFMFECLQDLKQQYEQLGSKLAILYGDTPQRVIDLAQELNADVYYNHDTNMPFGFQRDQEVTKNQRFKGYDNDAIIREPYNRDDWRKHCKEYLQTDQHTTPEELNTPPTLKDETSFTQLKKQFNITKQKTQVPPGGSSYAHKRLQEFLEELQAYPRSISSPNTAKKGCSAISAHLSLGAIGIREVYQETMKQPNSKARSFYLSRLYWNQHFTQKLQDFPDAVTTSVNPIYKNHNQKTRDEKLIEAWKQGKTGYPMVDASMRCLAQTGWLNFRMRAMVASFFCYILKQPWQEGADYMHYHLIDADTAINYEQWQMQAGTVGAHPPRIYNPTKQAHDNDPEGTFIRTWVDELNNVPTKHIAEPWKMSRLRQEQHCVIGEEYPRPIVDFTTEMRSARENYKRTIRQARVALKQPEIKRRASLSRARRKKRADNNQQTLQQYT